MPGNVNYDKMKEMERTNVCAKCGGELVTIWDGTMNRYALVCGQDHSHQGVKRRLSATQALKRGEFDQRTSPGTQAEIEKSLESLPPETSLMAKKDIATGRELSKNQIAMLVEFSDQCGLKAWLGHVCLYFGKPYVTIDGYYWKMHHDKRKFYVVCAPMTDEERKAYQVIDGDHAFIAGALTDGGVVLNKGIGIVTQEEMNKPSKNDPQNFAAPVAHDKPQRTAEKRAEWQVLRKMVPLGSESPGEESTPREPSPREPISQDQIDAYCSGKS